MAVQLSPAAVKRVKARRSGDTTGVRAFAALATGACAAGYAEMFTGFFGFWSLAAATWIALLPPLVLIRSRADLRRRWLSIVLLLLLLASVLAPSLASEDLVGFVLIVGIFLALTLVVALLFLYALTCHQLLVAFGTFGGVLAVLFVLFVRDPVLPTTESVHHGNVFTEIFRDLGRCFSNPNVVLSAIYASRQFLPAKVRVFIDYLAGLYSPTPYWEHGQAPG